jgi:hypothetical protein
MRFVIAKGTADGAAARTKMAEAITNLGEFRFLTRRHQKHHREKFYAELGMPKPRNRGNEHQTRFCFSMVQFWRKFGQILGRKKVYGFHASSNQRLLQRIKG